MYVGPLTTTFAIVLHMQEAFKEPDYTCVRQNLHRTAMALSETASFTIAQVVLDNQRRVETITQLSSEIVKLRHDMGRVSMQVKCR